MIFPPALPPPPSSAEAAASGGITAAGTPRAQKRGGRKRGVQGGKRQQLGGAILYRTAGQLSPAPEGQGDRGARRRGQPRMHEATECTERTR